jgi:hypothetical protein
MAFCTNCGATLPDGAAFCTRCGAKLAPAQQRSNPYASAPRPDAYTAPAYGAPTAYPAPAPKKTHTGLIIGIIAAVLVAAAVLVLFLTGVLGTPKEVGTWTLVSSSESSEFQPGSVTLVLSKDGKGYFKTLRVRSSGTYEYYTPLTWADQFFMAGYYSGSYVLNGDTMTMMFDGISFTFTRTGGVEKRNSLKPGQYSLLRYTRRGEDYTDDMRGSFLQVNDGGFGIINYGSGSESFTWDEYFVTVDGESYFYTFDGTMLTLNDGYYVLTFTRIG